jgi:hypothetical protein
MLLRYPNLLTAGVLLLSMGGIGASALPQLDRQESTVERVQYSDGGRCFNRCVYGRTVRRCQSAERSERENCCSVACDRRNNLYYRGWY